ncbi:MAG: purple acid phosphatase family protein [Promethearchaeota archaeon]
MKKKTVSKMMLLCMVLILVPSIYSDNSSLLPSVRANNFEFDDPKGIRLSLPDDPRYSIAISWYTYKLTETDIKFGILPGDLNLTDILSAETDHAEDTYIHHIVMGNLSTNTTYYYQIGGATSGWSDVNSFKTAPERNSSLLHFIAYGDNRSDRQLRRLINRAVLQNASTYHSEPVQFILHMGDMVSSGDEHDLFNDYFDDSQMLHESIPLLPIQGNHELGNFRQSYYREQFVLPENGNDEWYWALQYGSAFVMGLDSEAHGIIPYDSQSPPWIDSKLKDSNEESSVLWRFAMFHQPPFVSSSHLPRIDIRDSWSPIFDDNDVDIVFNGHCHLYERSFPVSSNGTISSNERYNYYDPDNPIYVVTGAAGRGGPIDRLPERENEHMVFSNFTWHYVNIFIANNYTTQQSTLIAKVVGLIPQYFSNGSLNEFDLSHTVLLDNFTITKDIPDGWQDSVKNTIYQVSGGATQQKILGLGLSGFVFLILLGIDWLILRRRFTFLKNDS